MQNEISQAFICYNFDDYTAMKTFSQYSKFEFGLQPFLCCVWSRPWSCVGHFKISTAFLINCLLRL